MKKLDEIMELMADEMANFRKGLLQLQKLSNELKNQSIPVSTEVMDKYLNLFFQQQKDKEGIATERFISIDKMLKNAYILPKKLGVIFGSFLILLITIVGYVTFQLIEAKNQKLEVYQLLHEEQTEFYARYLKDNPEVKENYEEWLQNQNIP